MTFQLRDYQTEAVSRGLQFLHSGGADHGLIVAPTGSGKSLVIASIAARLDGRCIIFQPSKEILEQNANKLLSYGFEPAVYSASLGQKNVGAITLATIGSAAKHPDLFADVRYVLVDEAHLVNAKAGQYQAFFAALCRARILGLTATPFRLSSTSYGSMLKFLTRTRPRVFRTMVHFSQIGDLMHQGFLVKPEYQIVTGFSRKALKYNTTGADYTDASVKRHFNAIGFADRLCRVVHRLLELGRKNVLVFTRFVEDAQAIVATIPGAAVVSAETSPSDRAALVAAFRTGEVPVVANVGIFGLGFDFPELETVVLARPTASLGLYYQQVGRLLRPHPLKTDAWVVDMVDLVGQFGRVEDLWLKAGGADGSLWEMGTHVAAPSGGQVFQPLTNVYLGGVRPPVWRRGPR